MVTKFFYDEKGRAEIGTVFSFHTAKQAKLLKILYKVGRRFVLMFSRK
jgi:hypothetical protein